MANRKGNGAAASNGGAAAVSVAAVSHHKAPRHAPLIKRDGRHTNWAYPLFVMTFLFVAVIGSTVVVHDWLVGWDGELRAALAEVGGHKYHFEPALAYFFVGYVFIMVLSRYLDCGSYIFYETPWCCNSALLMAAIGILTERPLLIGASVAGVCCDQSIWYVDCLGYLLIRKFPVGAAKYLIWPETTWSKKYLCTHHLWFMPLALWALGWYLPPYSFLLSCWFTSTSTGLSRFFTPKMWKDDYNNHEHYLNVNAGHEFWRDVKIKPLHMFNQSHAAIYLIFMFVVVNTALNGPPYLLLSTVLKLLSGR